MNECKGSLNNLEPASEASEPNGILISTLVKGHSEGIRR